MIRKGIKLENKGFKMIYLADNLTCSLHHKKSHVIQFLTAHLINAQGFKLKKGKNGGYWFKSSSYHNQEVFDITDVNELIKIFGKIFFTYVCNFIHYLCLNSDSSNIFNHNFIFVLHWNLCFIIGSFNVLTITSVNTHTFSFWPSSKLGNSGQICCSNHFCQFGYFSVSALVHSHCGLLETFCNFGHRVIFCFHPFYCPMKKKLYIVAGAIEFNSGHISKKSANQYRKLNYSHLETREITLILLTLKAYRIQQCVE